MQTLEYKITLIGDGTVGKTSLSKRFVRKAFKGDYMQTIGADISFKNLRVGNQTVKFQIWDIAGQLKWTVIRKNYFEGSAGALLVFDVTNPKTLESVPNWASEQWAGSKRGKIPIVLIGNKTDLRNSHSPTVMPEQGQELAIELSKGAPQDGSNVTYIETSAKTGQNVDYAFQILAEKIIAYVEKQLS